jgi:glucokinase
VDSAENPCGTPVAEEDAAMRERAVTGWAVTIGVDVGGTTISGGLVRDDGEVLATVETPTHVSGPGTALKTLLAVIHDVCTQARAHGWPVDGIGLGLPGPVDVGKGMMITAGPQNHVPELHGVPIAEQIEALTDLPTVVDNDVNALALGERAFGLGRGAASLTLLAIGTEIGGAFVAGDVLVRGAHGFAGELGHMPVKFDGPRCVCGGRGCLGVYLGGRLLAAEARRRVLGGAPSMLVEQVAGDVDAITTSMVFAAAAAGDPLAAALVDDACQALAATLATIVNGLDPEVIVITGGVAESLVPLRADIMRRTASYAFAHPLASTRIQITPSDKRDTVRGGAALFAYERARRAGSR